MAFLKRRLLWRVRRKLLISYVFIGFIPAILIVAFFLLGGVLLFSNFSAYLVQTRFRALAERAASIAETTAAEIQRAGGRDMSAILARRDVAIEAEFPGASFAVVAMTRPCSSFPAADQAQSRAAPIEIAGPWAHVDPPATVPDWVRCEGFAGFLTYERDGERQTATSPTLRVGSGSDINLSGGVTTHGLIRALAFPEVRNPGYAVIVDLVLSDRVRQQLREETGAVVSAIRRSLEVVPLKRRETDADLSGDSGSTALSVTLPSFTYLGPTDWASGNQVGDLMISLDFSVGEIYQRISGG